jgi:formylglycine-generating enzyme required for sulfatase activity
MVNAGEDRGWPGIRFVVWPGIRFVVLMVMCAAAACGHDEPAGGAPDAAVPVDAPAEDPPRMPNCAELASTCGPGGNESCCQAMPVTGGTFFRSYDGVGFTNMGFPAKVSDFVLDRYEVTVGRFRAFVDGGMGTRSRSPAVGAGAHRTLAGSGWGTGWSSFLAPDTMGLVKALKCGAPYETWTDMSGANESKPINCVTWYEAMAFCIWDGGYLATEAEWNYAASGGTQQRVFPWSTPSTSGTIDCTYANYYVDSPPGTFCVNGPTGGANRVGTEAAKGDGRWGHSDLGGGVWELTLDWYAAAYSATCDDCANLASGTLRVARGGSFLDNAPFLRASARGNLTPTDRSNVVGFRCARAPN